MFRSFITTVILVLAPVITHAAEYQSLLSNSGVFKSFGLTDSGDLGAYLNALYNVAVLMGSILVVLIIASAGLQYMTTDAYGQKKESIERIRNAVIGLLMLLGTYVFFNQINPDVLQFRYDIKAPATSPAPTSSTSSSGGNTITPTSSQTSADGSVISYYAEQDIATQSGAGNTYPYTVSQNGTAFTFYDAQTCNAAGFPNCPAGTYDEQVRAAAQSTVPRAYCTTAWGKRYCYASPDTCKPGLTGTACREMSISTSDPNVIWADTTPPPYENSTN